MTTESLPLGVGVCQEKVIEEWDIINSIYFYEWFPQYIIHEKVGNGHEWDKEVFNDIW